MTRMLLLALLYVLASPIYAVIVVQKVVKFWKAAKTMRAGTIACPHCDEVNRLDILATCGRCKTTEYGNRLRCAACGDTAKGFDCDACGVTIGVF